MPFFSWDRPVESESRPISGDVDDSGDVAEERCLGLAVLSQSCDVVRDASQTPYIEVAPLVEVEEQTLEEVRKGRRPRYAYVEGVADKRLVVDMSRVMTVAKSVARSWARTPGCSRDEERLRFSESVSRKYARFAFPDAFVDVIEPLRKRMQRRSGKDSPEGRAVDGLFEIRARASGQWSSRPLDVHLFFIRRDSVPGVEEEDWGRLSAEWLGLILASDAYKEGSYRVGGHVTELGDMTAEEYVTSRPLDLDHLSEPGPAEVPENERDLADEQGTGEAS
jgi:hypothetical protein